MSEPTERPPVAPPPPTATPIGNDTDDTLHHQSISAEAPSSSPPPSSAAAGAAAAAAAKASAAKASASAFASKLAFGGRKFLSPLATVTGVGSTGNAPAKEATPSSSVAAASSGEARSEASSSPSPQKSGGAAAAGAAAGAALVSSLAGANAAVSDAASAVTSSLGYLLTNVAATASAAVTTTPDSSSTTSHSSASLDAAELEQLEAEFQQATAQQRMKILEDLVQYRRADWNYLKAMHQGTTYWLNIALVRETQLLAHLGERAAIRRSVQFFYLGLGLGKLLSEVRHAHAVPLAGAQLLEELEYYFASATGQSMKLLVATSQPTLHVPLETKEKENDGHGDHPPLLEEPFRPTLYKWNQRPVFRWLVTPSIPFPLDYREVMLSLCDILAFVYSKLIEDNTCSENVFLFQAIVRFDEKIKKLVIDPVKKEFSTVASTVMTEELAGVRKTFASGGSHRPGSNQLSSAQPVTAATTDAAPPVESLSQ